MEPLQNAEHCNKTAERRQHWPAVPAKMTVCASKAVKVLWAKKKKKNVCIATISFSSWMMPLFCMQRAYIYLNTTAVQCPLWHFSPRRRYSRKVWLEVVLRMKICMQGNQIFGSITGVKKVTETSLLLGNLFCFSGCLSVCFSSNSINALFHAEKIIYSIHKLAEYKKR